MLGVIRRHWKPKSRSLGKRKKDEYPKTSLPMKEADEGEIRRRELAEDSLKEAQEHRSQVGAGFPDQAKLARTEELLCGIRLESEQCKAKLSSLKEDFNKMEEMVCNLLHFKWRIEQLKHEKSSISLTYESKIKKYLTHISVLERENFLLLNELKTLEASSCAQQPERVSRVLLERIKLLEQENSTLAMENEHQRLQYEHCLDDVANQVVQALLAQKTLREECGKLQRKVHGLEQQNRELTSMFQSSSPFLTDPPDKSSAALWMRFPDFQGGGVRRMSTGSSSPLEEQPPTFCCHCSPHFSHKSSLLESQCNPDFLGHFSGEILRRPSTLDFPESSSHVYEEVLPSPADTNTVIRREPPPPSETGSKDEGYSTMSSDVITDTALPPPPSQPLEEDKLPEPLPPKPPHTNIFSLLTPRGYKSTDPHRPRAKSTAEKWTLTEPQLPACLPKWTQTSRLGRSFSDPLLQSSPAPPLRSPSLQLVCLDLRASACCQTSTELLRATPVPSSAPHSPVPATQTSTTQVPPGVEEAEETLRQHGFVDDWLHKDNFTSPIDGCFTYDEEEVGNWSLSLTPEAEVWPQEEEAAATDLNSETTDFNPDFYRLCSGSCRSLPHVDSPTGQLSRPPKPASQSMPESPSTPKQPHDQTRPAKNEQTRIPVISSSILDKNRRNLLKTCPLEERSKNHRALRKNPSRGLKKSNHHPPKKAAQEENNKKLETGKKAAELADLEKKLADGEGSLTVAAKIQELNAFLSNREDKPGKNRQQRTAADNKEGYGTSWVHVDLADPQARASLLDSMVGSSSSSEDEILEHKHNQKLHALHRFRRHRKRASDRDAVISFIPRLRASIIDRKDFFFRFGEKEREAVACFDFLNELSTSPSDSEKAAVDCPQHDEHVSFSDSCAESFSSSTQSLTHLM